MFKKDQYIVLLEDIHDDFKKNYCYKQKESVEYLRVYKDFSGRSSGHREIRFEHKETRWRDASSIEILEYDKYNSPYDVTTLKTIKTLNKDTVKVGQKVRVIEDNAINLGFKYLSNNRASILKKGYIGIITEVEGGKTNASSDHTWVYIDKHGGIGTMLLELLEEPKSKEVVPEYVECIKGSNTDLSTNDFNVVGKIYEVESYNSKSEELKLKGFRDSIACIKFDGNSGHLSTDYKISTKEAFDLQNQPKPEVLVFGKFKIGSIVVSLCEASIHRKGGDMFKILPHSTKEFLYYRAETHNPCKDDWRQATEAEVKAFESGITNIKDMKTEEEYSFYVKYEPNFTEDIFNKLVDWCKNNIPSTRTWRTFTDNTYKSFQSTGYFFVEDGTKGLDQSFGVDNNRQGAKKQLSLSELCTLIGYKQEQPINTNTMELTGDWCIKVTDSNRHIVKPTLLSLYNPSKWTVSSDNYYGIKDGKLTAQPDTFGKELTLDEFKKLVLKEQVMSKEDELLAEAKRRFPVGSKVQCLVTKNFYSITEDIVFKIHYNSIFSYTNYGKGLYHKHYDGNNWAEVESKKSSEEFKVGEIAIAQGYKFKEITVDIEVPLLDNHLKYPLVPEECITFAEPKKEKYKFSEVEYLAKPINQQLDLPIVKKYKKKSIINL